jgi:UDP-N-acetylenolpyruvoylglucosamine reductase
MTMRLADVTTLRVGGPAQDVVVATDEATLIDTVRDADRRGIPTLMIFSGGNAQATKVGAVSKTQLAAFIDSNIA